MGCWQRGWFFSETLLHCTTVHEWTAINRILLPEPALQQGTSPCLSQYLTLQHHCRYFVIVSTCCYYLCLSKYCPIKLRQKHCNYYKVTLARHVSVLTCLNMLLLLINRPSVAWAVLQTALSLINRPGLAFSTKPSKHHYTQTERARQLTLWEYVPPTTCHMSWVMFNISRVMCQVSNVKSIFFFFFFLDKVVALVGGGSVINWAYLV